MAELGERLQAYKIRMTNYELLSKMLRNEEKLEDACIRLRVEACQVDAEVRIAEEEVDTLEKELSCDG